MKLAPLARALRAVPEIDHVVVHTGQHYDIEMSEAFFRDLDIGQPDVRCRLRSCWCRKWKDYGADARDR